MAELEQSVASEPVQTTRVNRGWMMKMLIFIVILAGFGGWGAMDAFVWFPQKGAAHAKFMLYQYLSRLSDQGVLLRDADVRDPAAELARLNEDRSISDNSVEAARRNWLLSLSRIRDLEAITRENEREIERRQADPGSGQQLTPTLFPDPRGMLDALHDQLQNAKVPAALNAYDIPLQYVFMVIGFGGAAWILLTIARSSRTVYRYAPGAMRLTLPDGRSFTPSEIRDFDKRNWHKYYLYFTVEGFDGEVKFDLLRHAPLEEWVEAMRRARPGYDPAEDEPPAGDAPAETPPADTATEETAGAGAAADDDHP